MQTQYQRYQQVIRPGLENINCIIAPIPSVGGLFLGDIISTKKAQLLEKHKIQAILSCSIESKATVDHIQTKYLPAHDNVKYDMKQHFEETSSWIKQRIDKGVNVLIHCHAGVSRSASVVIAYLIRENKMKFQQALRFVREKRPRVKPNEAFMAQLQQYEKQARGQKIEKLCKQKSETEKISQKQQQSKIEKPKQVIQVSDKVQKKIQNSFSKTSFDQYTTSKNKQNMTRPSTFYYNHHQNFNIQYNPYQLPQKIQNQYYFQPVFTKTLNLAQNVKSERQSFQKPVSNQVMFQNLAQTTNGFKKSEMIRPNTAISKPIVNVPRPSIQTKPKGIQLFSNVSTPRRP